jgi:uncharacterized protein YjbJ (UPF0337 family)
MKDPKNLTVEIGKMKQKFAGLTDNDNLFIEGGNDISQGKAKPNVNDIKNRLIMINEKI